MSTRASTNRKLILSGSVSVASRSKKAISIPSSMKSSFFWSGAASFVFQKQNTLGLAVFPELRR